MTPSPAFELSFKLVHTALPTHYLTLTTLPFHLLLDAPRAITLHKPPRAELRAPLMYTQRWIDVRDEELLADRDVAFRNHRDA